MRSLILSVVVGAASLGVLGLTPAKAQAWYPIGPRVYYPTYAYSPTYPVYPAVTYPVYPAPVSTYYYSTPVVATPVVTSYYVAPSSVVVPRPLVRRVYYGPGVYGW